MRLRLSLTTNWAKLNTKNMDENDGGRTDNLAKGKVRLGQYTHNRVIREVEAAGTTGGSETEHNAQETRVCQNKTGSDKRTQTD